MKAIIVETPSFEPSCGKEGNTGQVSVRANIASMHTTTITSIFITAEALAFPFFSSEPESAIPILIRSTHSVSTMIAGAAPSHLPGRPSKASWFVSPISFLPSLFGHNTPSDPVSDVTESKAKLTTAPRVEEMEWATRVLSCEENDWALDIGSVSGVAEETACSSSSAISLPEAPSDAVVDNHSSTSAPETPTPPVFFRRTRLSTRCPRRTSTLCQNSSEQRSAPREARRGALSRSASFSTCQPGNTSACPDSSERQTSKSEREVARLVCGLELERERMMAEARRKKVNKDWSEEMREWSSEFEELIA